MDRDPLAPPPAGRSETLGLFLEHFGIGRERAEHPEALLAAVASTFSRIPYENLTKILKLWREGTPERARRLPPEVIAEHARSGAGGTCFSLTAALLHIVRALGFRAEPILADRKYGADTHCAMVVDIGGVPHLLDPGFLITRPIPLAGLASERRIPTGFSEVVLVPREGGSRIDLDTIQSGNRTYRLTFKASPADPGAFLRAWDASFGWEMMTYPLLTRAEGGRHLYLQGTRFQVREARGVERSELDPSDLALRIQREFGVDAAIAARALEVLRKKGGIDGGSPAR